MSGRLDVARLYRAMVNLDTDNPGVFNIVAISEPDTRPVAEALADEYAWLSEDNSRLREAADLLLRWRDASLGGDLSALGDLTAETTEFLGDSSPLGHGTPVPEEATLPSGDARVAGL